MFLFLVFCAWHSLLCSGCCCLSSVLLLSARAGEDLLKSSEDAAAGLSTELTITLYEMLGRQSEWWALFSLFSYYPGSELEMGSCSSQDQQQKTRFSSSYLSLRIYIYVCIYTFFFSFLYASFTYIHFFPVFFPGGQLPIQTRDGALGFPEFCDAMKQSRMSLSKVAQIQLYWCPS